MFYRVCLIINIVLSLLFLLVAGYGIIDGDFSESVLILGGSIFIFGIISLCFSLICIRVNKINKENNLISNQLKTWGKLFFVFTLLTILVILYFTIDGITNFVKADIASFAPKGVLISYIVTFSASFLICLTAIFNLIFFSKTLRKNKSVVIELIDKIGII